MVYQGSSNGDYTGHNRLASLFSTGKWLLIFFRKSAGENHFLRFHQWNMETG
jgi:hypothetical protein